MRKIPPVLNNGMDKKKNEAYINNKPIIETCLAEHSLVRASNAFILIQPSVKSKGLLWVNLLFLMLI